MDIRDIGGFRNIIVVKGRDYRFDKVKFIITKPI
jgi:hypothetical protein